MELFVDSQLCGVVELFDSAAQCVGRQSGLGGEFFESVGGDPGSGLEVLGGRVFGMQMAGSPPPSRESKIMNDGTAEPLSSCASMARPNWSYGRDSLR